MPSIKLRAVGREQHSSIRVVVVEGRSFIFEGVCFVVWCVVAVAVVKD